MLGLGIRLSMKLVHVTSVVPPPEHPASAMHAQVHGLNAVKSDDNPLPQTIYNLVHKTDRAIEC